ncbi:MAG: DUF4339 domain-containing protein [Polaribacter sp.]|nr:DUF4339 domain-containing protein [Polaribacter sp.]
MKKYFYSNDNEKNGPFSFEELKNENIKKETLIWYEGLDDWTKASDLNEMMPILELKPPSFSEIKQDPVLIKNPEIRFEEKNPTTKKFDTSGLKKSEGTHLNLGGSNLDSTLVEKEKKNVFLYWFITLLSLIIYSSSMGYLKLRLQSLIPTMIGALLLPLILSSILWLINGRKNFSKINMITCIILFVLLSIMNFTNKI